MANVNQVGNTLNNVTGSGKFVGDTSPVLVTPNIGTPSAGNLSSCTALPISTGVSGLGAGVATFLGTPSSANLATAVTDETGSGLLVFGTSPALTTPRVATSINDSNGATALAITATASAVNYFTLANAATAGAPTLTSTGSDSDINAYIKSKGTGQCAFLDTNGVASIAGGGVASAVNWVVVSNAASGNAPIIAAVNSGISGNLNLKITGQGTGGVDILGRTSGSLPGTGYVGERISSQILFASAIACAGSGTAKNLTSISLTAGNWEVTGNIFFATGATFSGLVAGISATTGTQPDQSLQAGPSSTGGQGTSGVAVVPNYISVSATTTYYLVGTAYYPSGSPTMCGILQAVRLP